jgi:hypothetical protein
VWYSESAPITGRFFVRGIAAVPTNLPELRTIRIASSIFRRYGGNMKRLPIFLMVVAAACVHADVYKSVNEKGEVVYSDQPAPNAQRMKLPELPTYTPPPIPRFSTGSTASKPAAANPYKSVRIVVPENDATVWDNQGMIRVEIALDPPLMTQKGHKIQVYLNGEPRGMPVGTTSISFSNVDRGTYTLTASVVNAEGVVLASAEPVVFHLHRASVQNPNSPLYVNPNPNPSPKPRPKARP